MKCSDLKQLKLDESGKIGYTFKTLGSGFWALKQNDFRKAITKIVLQVDMVIVCQMLVIVVLIYRTYFLEYLFWCLISLVSYIREENRNNHISSFRPIWICISLKYMTLIFHILPYAACNIKKPFFLWKLFFPEIHSLY